MPLTNEAVIPIGMKDKWNTNTASNAAAGSSISHLISKILNWPYIWTTPKFGTAVPSLNALRIQSILLARLILEMVNQVYFL